MESGEVSAEEAGEELPDFVVEEGLVEIYEPPPVYTPTVTYSSSNGSELTTTSTSSSAVVDSSVASDPTSVLAIGSSTSRWMETISIDTTTVTLTTVTTTETYTDYTTTETCTDAVCVSTTNATGTHDNVTVGQPSSATTVTTATSVVEAECASGGWSGLGDWCIVEASDDDDSDHVSFQLTASTDIRIDAETNLTDEGWDSASAYGDPYIYLHYDTDTDEGAHSGDMSEITVGNLIEADDDGGADCVGAACWNIPSGATDPDEWPNVDLANGDPVIDNVSDSWDSRIERTLGVGDYVLRASAYDEDTGGWYRLTILEDD